MFEARFVAFGFGCLLWSVAWDSCLPEARHAGGSDYILANRGDTNLRVDHVWLNLRVC